jgi:hypothetical protein
MMTSPEDISGSDIGFGGGEPRERLRDQRGCGYEREQFSRSHLAC